MRRTGGRRALARAAGGGHRGNDGGLARVRTLAAALLLPYLGWVPFASALTWSLWRRAPTLP